MHTSMVDDHGLADVVLEIGYTFAWDYPFKLKYQNVGLLLLAGNGSSTFSIPAGGFCVRPKSCIKETSATV
ncbi:MAG: hypothetical protein EPN47_11875 [Acidobacteria bacterium]|nr:MAG: hypothetical protein EPN47_11875 [Acidobacteriota bacterium]